MSQRLKIGDLAPDFTGLTTNGQKLKLSQFAGKPIWLIFYRYPKCPLCNMHIYSMSFRYEAIENLGLEVLAVFESPLESFPQEAKYPTHPKFNLVSDPKKKIYELYHTENKLSGVFRPSVLFGLAKAVSSGYRQGKVEGALGQLPAHFLISESGKIEDIYYGKTINDHIPWNRVDAFVQATSGANPKKGNRSSSTRS